MTVRQRKPTLINVSKLISSLIGRNSTISESAEPDKKQKAATEEESKNDKHVEECADKLGKRLKKRQSFSL